MNPIIGGLLRTAGQTVEGYGVDKQRRITDALNQRKIAGDEKRDAVLNAIAGRSYDPNRGAVINVADGSATPIPGLPDAPAKPTDVSYSPTKFRKKGTPDAIQGFASNRGGYFTSQMQPVDFEVEPYEEPSAAPKVSLVPVDEQTPTGEVRRVLRPEKEGLEVPGPSNIMAGSAALKKAIASNQSQLAVLDDALKELDVHPDAVGLKRGIGEMIPLAGGIQDAFNQRVDPQGVAARAQISNLGSLKIHDRSGAAVTVSEFPRLKPFIPTVGDTPDAIRTKLGKLREALLVETGELEKSMTTRPAGGARTAPSAAATSGDPEFDALMAKFKRP